MLTEARQKYHEGTKLLDRGSKLLGEGRRLHWESAALVMEAKEKDPSLTFVEVAEFFETSTVTLFRLIKWYKAGDPDAPIDWGNKPRKVTIDTSIEKFFNEASDEELAEKLGSRMPDVIKKAPPEAIVEAIANEQDIAHAVRQSDDAMESIALSDLTATISGTNKEGYGPGGKPLSRDYLRKGDLFKTTELFVAYLDRKAEMFVLGWKDDAPLTDSYRVRISKTKLRAGLKRFNKTMMDILGQEDQS